jgi:hypothetical protein
VLTYRVKRAAGGACGSMHERQGGRTHGRRGPWRQQPQCRWQRTSPGPILLQVGVASHQLRPNASSSSATDSLGMITYTCKQAKHTVASRRRRASCRAGRVAVARAVVTCTSPCCACTSARSAGCSAARAACVGRWSTSPLQSMPRRAPGCLEGISAPGGQPRRPRRLPPMAAAGQPAASSCRRPRPPAAPAATARPRLSPTGARQCCAHQASEGTTYRAPQSRRPCRQTRHLRRHPRPAAASTRPP